MGDGFIWQLNRQREMLAMRFGWHITTRDMVMQATGVALGFWIGVACTTGLLTLVLVLDGAMQ